MTGFDFQDNESDEQNFVGINLQKIGTTIEEVDPELEDMTNPNH
mgnify:CR=1 FL=1